MKHHWLWVAAAFSAALWLGVIIAAALLGATTVYGAAGQLTVRFTLPAQGNRGTCPAPELVNYDTLGVTHVTGHWRFWPAGTPESGATEDSLLGPIGALVVRHYPLPAGNYFIRAWSTNSGTPEFCDTLVTKTVIDSVHFDPRPPATIAWISDPDTAVATKLSVPAVTASGFSPPNAPTNTLDGDLQTRWSADGDGQWIRLDLGATRQVAFLKMAFWRGVERSSRFDIALAATDLVFTTVSQITSTALNPNLQTFDFPDAPGARYVRITGHGTTIDNWASYSEIEVWGQ